LYNSYTHQHTQQSNNTGHSTPQLSTGHPSEMIVYTSVRSVLARRSPQQLCVFQLTQGKLMNTHLSQLTNKRCFCRLKTTAIAVGHRQVDLTAVTPQLGWMNRQPARHYPVNNNS